MRYLLSLGIGFALMLALMRLAPAATPDEVRAEAQLRALKAQQEAVARETKAAREGTSVATAKPHIWIMTVHTPGHPLTFLQVYQDRGACYRNQGMLVRQLHTLGWGVAACLEQVAP